MAMLYSDGDVFSGDDACPMEGAYRRLSPLLIGGGSRTGISAAPSGKSTCRTERHRAPHDGCATDGAEVRGCPEEASDGLPYPMTAITAVFCHVLGFLRSCQSELFERQYGVPVVVGAHFAEREESVLVAQADAGADGIRLPDLSEINMLSVVREGRKKRG